jgi:hypothetical protein
LTTLPVFKDNGIMDGLPLSHRLDSARYTKPTENFFGYIAKP